MRGMLRSSLVGMVCVAFGMVAVVGFSLFDGNSDVTHAQWPHQCEDINGDGTVVPSHMNDPQDTTLELDMQQDLGGAWCNPVDWVRTVQVGEQYSVAVCLVMPPSSPGGFQFELDYNSALNDCVDWPGSSFDSNPDANLGLTKWDGTLPITVNGLGTGWDCNIGGTSPPTCADPEGRASLKCATVSGTAELPFGYCVPEPIAVVTLRALAPGFGDLTLWNVEVGDANGDAYLSCFPNDTNYCTGGLDISIAPTSTVTPTRSPTATPTPHGVGGAVMLPPGATDAESGDAGSGNSMGSGGHCRGCCGRRMVRDEEAVALAATSSGCP
jgi:hypothetical protein